DGARAFRIADDAEERELGRGRRRGQRHRLGDDGYRRGRWRGRRKPAARGEKRPFPGGGQILELHARHRIGERGGALVLGCPPRSSAEPSGRERGKNSADRARYHWPARRHMPRRTTVSRNGPSSTLRWAAGPDGWRV